MYHVTLVLQCIYIDAVIKELKIGIGRREVRFKEEGRQWRLPGFLYNDDLVLCGESEEVLGAKVGRFIEVCRRRGLKVNAGKSKVMLLGWEEGLECEVCVNEIRLKYVLEFKYLGFILDESGTDEAECSRKVVSERRVAGAIRSLVNAKSLQLECVRVLHESLLVLVLTYSIETMVRGEKERSRIWAVQMDNLRGLLGIRIMDTFPNARIMQLCGGTKCVDEKIEEGVLRGSAMWRECKLLLSICIIQIFKVRLSNPSHFILSFFQPPISIFYSAATLHLSFRITHLLQKKFPISIHIFIYLPSKLFIYLLLL